MTFARTDKSHLAEWWFTIDRTLLGMLLTLAAAGCLVALAATPAVAVKRGLPAFALAERHIIIALGAVLLMVAVSLLSPRQVRRLALTVLAASLFGLVLVLVIGPEINGARRWLRAPGLSIQPSEFAKPAFAVITAWLLAETARRPDIPARGLAIGLFITLATLLLLQPDVGQTLLITLVFAGLLVLSGQPLRGIAALALVAIGGLLATYATFPHVRTRLDRFLGNGGDTYQTDRALQSFLEGGVLGRGPGEGTIKLLLPDAHTDFVFAVIAEEFGIAACLAVLILIALIVLRALIIALDHPRPATGLAIAGLTLLLAIQAAINMGVAVGLLPAKGMTLPFISNGGSSTLAIGLTCGMLLALTRRRPDAVRTDTTTFAPAHP